MTSVQPSRKFYAYMHVPRGSSRLYPLYALCFSPSSESWEVRAGNAPEFDCVKKESFAIGKDELTMVEVELMDDVRREDKYTAWKWYCKSDLLHYFEREMKFNAETRMLLGHVLSTACAA